MKRFLPVSLSIVENILSKKKKWFNTNWTGHPSSRQGTLWKDKFASQGREADSNAVKVQAGRRISNHMTLALEKLYIQNLKCNFYCMYTAFTLAKVDPTIRDSDHLYLPLTPMIRFHPEFSRLLSFCQGSHAGRTAEQCHRASARSQNADWACKGVTGTQLLRIQCFVSANLFPGQFSEDWTDFCLWLSIAESHPLQHHLCSQGTWWTCALNTSKHRGWNIPWPETKLLLTTVCLTLFSSGKHRDRFILFSIWTIFLHSECTRPEDTNTSSGFQSNSLKVNILRNV